jgi:hypothetical protein
MVYNTELLGFWTLSIVQKPSNSEWCTLVSVDALPSHAHVLYCSVSVLLTLVKAIIFCVTMKLCLHSEWQFYVPMYLDHIWVLFLVMSLIGDLTTFHM